MLVFCLLFGIYVCVGICDLLFWDVCVSDTLCLDVFAVFGLLFCGFVFSVFEFYWFCWVMSFG